MDFQSAMETFAEAWMAANTGQHQTQALALTSRSKSPSIMKKERSVSPSSQNPRDTINSPRYGQTIVSPTTTTTSRIDHHLNTTNNNNRNNLNNAQRSTPNILPSSTTSQSISATTKNSTSPASTNENGLSSKNIMIEKILSSPSLDRKDFDFAKVNAKSLPLHCVVESVHSLQASFQIDTRNLWKRRLNIETDSYVIIAASTPWSEIVTTALQRLGYSIDIANTARGSIVIKNWKPIPLENISDNPVIPVSDILGELTSVVTLRIVIVRTKPSTYAEIKDKLLRLLVLHSHAVLRSTGCPLDEVTLSQICRSAYQNSFPFSGDISEEVRGKFDQWWSNQLSPQSPLGPKMLPYIVPHQNELDFTAGHSSLHNNRTETLLENHHSAHTNMMVHPALQTIHSHQYPTSQKTRMRTSFDPEMELPKLQRWFQENPHPSRQQIQSYVIQLNSLESRQGRKPLDVNNVVYWFKNARAAQKRTEMRVQVMGNGYINHGQHGTNILFGHPSDYVKSSPSMKSDDIDNVSQNSDDLDNDSSLPSLPQLPLSLITHERNHSDTNNSEHKEENSIANNLERNNNNNNNNSNNNNNNSSNNNNNDNFNNNTNSNNTTNDNNNANNSNDDCQNNCEHNNNNRDLESNETKNLNSESSERYSSLKNSLSKSDDDLDMDESDSGQLDGFRTPSPDPRRDLSFAMVPNSMFSHSVMYMNHYMPSISQTSHSHHNASAMTSGLGNNLNLSGLSNEERRKRNRTFIDPVTEVPKLEQWFAMNTHPSHSLILKYTEDLNRMPYRQKFPRLESKNVQFWFKNRRAKCKRLKMSLYDPQQCSQLSTLNAFVPKYDAPKIDGGTPFDSPKYDNRE